MIQGAILSLTEIGFVNPHAAALLSGAPTASPTSAPAAALAPPTSHHAHRSPGYTKAPGEPALPPECLNCGNDAGHTASTCPLEADPAFIDRYANRYAVAKEFIAFYRAEHLASRALPTPPTLPVVPAPCALPTASAPAATQFVTPVGENDEGIEVTSPITPLTFTPSATPSSIPSAMPPPPGPTVSNPLPSYSEIAEVKKFITWIKLGMNDARLQFTKEEKTSIANRLIESWMTEHKTHLLMAICEGIAHSKGYHFQDPTHMHPTPWTPGNHANFGIPAFIRMGSDARGNLSFDHPDLQPQAAPTPSASITAVTTGMEHMDVETRN